MSHYEYKLRNAGPYYVGAGGRSGGPAGRTTRGRGGWTASRLSAAERRNSVSGRGGGAGYGLGAGQVECNPKSNRKKRKKRKRRRRRLGIPP